MTREKMLDSAFENVMGAKDMPALFDPSYERWMFDATVRAIEAAGVRLVPSEPTEEMQVAAMNDFGGHMNGADVRCLYRAMLAASPYAPQKDEKK